MVRKYINRDWTHHARTTEYLSDDDEYIKLEIFSCDPEHTQTYAVEYNSLVAENAQKVFFKDLVCFQSKDKINPVEITLNYSVKENGLYRIDLLYEQNSNMYSDNEYNTHKDLTGWYDIYKSGSKVEHKATINKVKKTHIVYPATAVDAKTKKLAEQAMIKKGKITKQDIKNNKYLDDLIAKVNEDKSNFPKDVEQLKFEGENNVLKRKTIFRTLDEGNWKFEFGIPHNCYVIGAIVRKIVKFWGTNNDEAGTNLQFTKATLTNSDMLKPTELQCTIGYDNDFDCEKNRSGLYIEYMDECNLYVRNNEGIIERKFGGYVSTPAIDKSREQIDIHCADRLKDGENKYILDQLLLQKGEGADSTKEYENTNSINFNRHAEVLKYLCEMYEVSLKHNISSNYRVDGETWSKGFIKTFGKKKDIKKVTVVNGQVTVNKNSIMLRNNSDGTKKQVFTLYKPKTPQNITNYPHFHITYGLGNVKTDRKLKETTKVDVGNTVPGAQKFGKCGVSQDKKYVMAIGTTSSAKDSGHYGTYYKSVFENKCPHCGKATLRWDSCRSDTKCIFTQGWNGSKGKWGVAPIETEITCNNCDSDFSAMGNEKDSPWKKLKKVGSTVKSSKAEQDKLHRGEMVAVAGSNVSVSSEDIFKAISKACKGWTHSTNTGTTASYLEKHGVGDCWAWSDWISKQLKKYKVNHKILQEHGGTHRSVVYQNAKGKYVTFPYRDYGLPKGTRDTDGSRNGYPVYRYTAGGRINQATTSKSTTKTQTVETTITKGYDRENPFQGYLDIVYSGSKSKKAKKYHIYVDFTQKAVSNNSLSGLKPVWVNNSSKRITLKNFIDKAKSYSGLTNIYLHSISFITPKIKTTNDKKKSTWYTNDKSTVDNSSCKMNLYSIEFNEDAGAEPEDLQACGKSVNELMKSVVEKAGYIVDMEYAEHRCDDKIHFKVDDNNTSVFTATEGDDNNILEWGNITYNPANELYNVSRCVFKKNTTNKYFYVDTKFLDSILKYQEQCTLITENDGIGEKEALWNAKHSEKLNPEQTYSFTLTVKGCPNVRLKDLVTVVADMKKLNTLKETESITIRYDIKSKPVIQTELGLGELAPDLLVKQNIKKLRDNAKKSTTSFYGTALPVDENIYEWEY